METERIKKFKCMKKLITLLIVFLSVGITVKSANTYLIYSATGGTWTNTAGITGPVLVNLSTSLNAWFAGQSFNSGDQVWIIKGTYVLTDSIKLSDGVSLYGGFSGGESSISARAKGTNAWDFTNETIIDGNAIKQGFLTDSITVPGIIDGLSIQNCKNSSSSTLGAAATLKGAITMQNCIIRNCNTTYATTLTNTSGGVVLTGGAIAKDCYIHDNTSAGYGAGVNIYGNKCMLNGCKITNNSNILTGWGGGVALYSTTSGVKVLNCNISNNTSVAKSGGGLLLFSTGTANADTITISHCTFTSNTVPSGSGGGLYINTKADNIVNVTNCTFTSNSSGVSSSSTTGGGGTWIGSGTTIIDHCAFNNNAVTTSRGGGIMVGGAGTITISNSVFAGNTGPSHGAAMILTYSAKVINSLFYGNKGGNVAYVGTATGTFGTFNNCTFASNTNPAGTVFGGVYLSTPTTQNAKFLNCLFYNGGSKPIAVDPVPPATAAILPDVTYCGFDSTATIGKTTFTDPTNIYTVYASTYMNAANNDFHLAANSPAIDAGMYTSDYTTDLVGFSRDANYDMGAYEYDPSYVPNAVSKVENTFDCYAYGNKIIIRGLDNDRVVNIYSVTGVRVFSKKTVDGTLSVNLPAGIYVVNVASSNKKVMVR